MRIERDKAPVIIDPSNGTVLVDFNGGRFADVDEATYKRYDAIVAKAKQSLEPKEITPTTPPKPTDKEREELEREYADLFGRKPHPKMTDERLKEKLNESRETN